MRAIFALLLLLANPVWADGERAGYFDYYVLSLSWSPNWCALTGDVRGEDQCNPRHDYGWVLHGLWPQQEKGWPAYCHTSKRAPSRAMTAAMIDIMGSSGLAWHQWKKHGSCSGLSAESYYRLARQAYGQINRPQIFRKLKNPIKLPAKVVEQAFMEANPKLLQNQITITCNSGHIQEARLCLTRDLKPRKCGVDVIRDCTHPRAIMTPVR
ncbi:MAG: ribonuclease T2 [Rhodobacteraceae bacterium]|nr:ribonuclease T2 [Paracoccaceae bacterium]